MLSGLRLAFVAGFALLVMACPPRINSFTVAPVSVCSGDEPSLARWDGRGDLALQVQLDDPRVRIDAAPDGGSDAQPPPPGPGGSHVIMLRLAARDDKGEERGAQTRWIQQFPDTFPTTIAFPADPADGGVSASGDKSPERWADRFEVATVAALDGRRIEVSHGGKSAVVGAAPSEEFVGTPLAGRWGFLWKSDGSGPAPEVLRVAVVARCKRRSP